MNILYILGNGFDKAQNMATSYPEFYEYLKTKVDGSSPVLLQNLVQDIKANSNLWSDMELALGNFTQKAVSVDEFENTYYLLSDNLRDYLKEQCSTFNPTVEYKKSTAKAFAYPTKGLEASDKQLYNSVISNFPGGIYMDIVTLNYTDTVEKLLNLDGRFPKNIDNGVLKSLNHVHGTLEDAIIIGVDNENQISNKEFQSNDDLKDLLVKQQSNIAMKEIRHQSFEDLIKNAHIIVIYGASLGLTDERWWKLIGEQMTKRTNLLIIYHVFDTTCMDRTRTALKGRLTRKSMDLLIERMKIQADDKIKNRIFVSINSKVFTL